MLAWLQGRFRCRAALTLAVAYAFCLIAPHAAIAFVDAASAVKCLAQHHGQAHAHRHDGMKVHVHADGSAHQHSPGDVPAKQDADGAQHGTCCGLFCLTALAAEPAVTLAAPALSTSVGPPADSGLASRGPDRINRPPIA